MRGQEGDVGGFEVGIGTVEGFQPGTNACGIPATEEGGV